MIRKIGGFAIREEDCNVSELRPIRSFYKINNDHFKKE